MLLCTYLPRHTDYNKHHTCNHQVLLYSTTQVAYFFTYIFITSQCFLKFVSIVGAFNLITCSLTQVSVVVWGSYAQLLLHLVSSTRTQLVKYMKTSLTFIQGMYPRFLQQEIRYLSSKWFTTSGELNFYIFTLKYKKKALVFKICNKFSMNMLQWNKKLIFYCTCKFNFQQQYHRHLMYTSVKYTVFTVFYILQVLPI